MTAPVILLMAAGAGSRWKASGGMQIAPHKLLAPLSESRVIDLAMAHAFASGLAVHACVRADTPKEVAAVCKILASKVHMFPETHGMGDVIAAGVKATANAGGWLILPADMPLISHETIVAVAAALEEHAVVAPQHDEQNGHPVGFNKSCRAALVALSGDTGARAVVQAHLQAGTTHLLPVDDAGILMDIDTPEDLQRATDYLRDHPGRPARPSV